MKNFFARFGRRTPGGPDGTPPQKEPPTVRSGYLTDITRGLHHAAASTQALIANQYITILNQFFDSLPDGTLQAKMVRVALDEGHYIMVPLVSLVAPKGLTLDKMKASLAVRVHEVEIEEATHAVENSDATRASFKVSVSPRHDHKDGRFSDAVDIELDFVASDPPESVQRIIEQYANMVQPRPVGPDSQFPAPKLVSLTRPDPDDAPDAPAAGPATEPPAADPSQPPTPPAS